MMTVDDYSKEYLDITVTLGTEIVKPRIRWRLYLKFEDILVKEKRLQAKISTKIYLHGFILRLA